MPTAAGVGELTPLAANASAAPAADAGALGQEVRQQSKQAADARSSAEDEDADPTTGSSTPAFGVGGSALVPASETPGENRGEHRSEHRGSAPSAPAVELAASVVPATGAQAAERVEGSEKKLEGTRFKVRPRRPAGPAPAPQAAPESQGIRPVAEDPVSAATSDNLAPSRTDASGPPQGSPRQEGVVSKSSSASRFLFNVEEPLDTGGSEDAASVSSSQTGGSFDALRLRTIQEKKQLLETSIAAMRSWVSDLEKLESKVRQTSQPGRADMFPTPSPPLSRQPSKLIEAELRTEVPEPSAAAFRAPPAGAEGLQESERDVIHQCWDALGRALDEAIQKHWRLSARQDHLKKEISKLMHEEEQLDMRLRNERVPEGERRGPRLPPQLPPVRLVERGLTGGAFGGETPLAPSFHPLRGGSALSSTGTASNSTLPGVTPPTSSRAPNNSNAPTPRQPAASSTQVPTGTGSELLAAAPSAAAALGALGAPGFYAPPSTTMALPALSSSSTAASTGDVLRRGLSEGQELYADALTPFTPAFGPGPSPDGGAYGTPLGTPLGVSPTGTTVAASLGEASTGMVPVAAAAAASTLTGVGSLGAACAPAVGPLDLLSDPVHQARSEHPADPHAVTRAWPDAPGAFPPPRGVAASRAGPRNSLAGSTPEATFEQSLAPAVPAPVVAPNVHQGIDAGWQNEPLFLDLGSPPGSPLPRDGHVRLGGAHNLKKSTSMSDLRFTPSDLRLSTYVRQAEEQTGVNFSDVTAATPAARPIFNGGMDGVSRDVQGYCDPPTYGNWRKGAQHAIKAKEQAGMHRGT